MTVYICWGKFKVGRQHTADTITPASATATTMTTTMSWGNVANSKSYDDCEMVDVGETGTVIRQPRQTLGALRGVHYLSASFSPVSVFVLDEQPKICQSGFVVDEVCPGRYCWWGLVFMVGNHNRSKASSRWLCPIAAPSKLQAICCIIWPIVMSSGWGFRRNCFIHGRRNGNWQRMKRRDEKWHLCIQLFMFNICIIMVKGTSGAESYVLLALL